MCYYPECVWSKACDGPAAATIVGGMGLMWTPEGCPNALSFFGKEDPVLQKIEAYCEEHNYKRVFLYNRTMIDGKEYIGAGGIPVWLVEEDHHFTEEDLQKMRKENPKKLHKIARKWCAKPKKWWQFWR